MDWEREREGQRSEGEETGEESAESRQSQLKSEESAESDLVAVRLFSPIRSTSAEALKAEVVAAEAALQLRAEVDGPVVVYDSPAVSIVLRKLSPALLMRNGSELEAPDGASIHIPADPRVKGRYDTPVTISVTSYHAGDQINKAMPKIKFSHTNSSNSANSNSSNSSEPVERVDRVDFFMTKTSVTWHGTVNVKVPGLSANVPARDRPWTPLGETNERYAEEKAEVKAELERLASLDLGDQLRGYRKLAKKWHPDKHPPEERDKVTDIFEYLQELRLALGLK